MVFLGKLDAECEPHILVIFVVIFIYLIFKDFLHVSRVVHFIGGYCPKYNNTGI